MAFYNKHVHNSLLKIIKIMFWHAIFMQYDKRVSPLSWRSVNFGWNFFLGPWSLTPSLYLLPLLLSQMDFSIFLIFSIIELWPILTHQTGFPYQTAATNQAGWGTSSKEYGCIFLKCCLYSVKSAITHSSENAVLPSLYACVVIEKGERVSHSSLREKKTFALLVIKPQITLASSWFVLVQWFHFELQLWFCRCTSSTILS